MALNKIIIMGRLTRDPELKTTPGGASVTNFTLAVDRDYIDKETGKREADFIDCVAWRGTAEFVTRYFTKGSTAVVIGRLQIRDYPTEDGGKRRAAEVVADNVYFGDSKTTNAGQQAEPAQAYKEPNDAPAYEELSNDEDLPF